MRFWAPVAAVHRYPCPPPLTPPTTEASDEMPVAALPTKGVEAKGKRMLRPPWRVQRTVLAPEASVAEPTTTLPSAETALPPLRSPPGRKPIGVNVGCARAGAQGMV